MDQIKIKLIGLVLTLSQSFLIHDCGKGSVPILWGRLRLLDKIDDMVPVNEIILKEIENMQA